MIQQPEESLSSAGSEAPGEAATPGVPTLAEDLLLLLFQPNSGLRQGTGTIAGENTLFYVLAGAVLADLGLGEHVRTGTGKVGTTTVEAVAENPPEDHILRSAWEYVADKPRGVQTVLAAIGPTLREPLLDRLVERGDVRRGTRKALGLFNTSVLEDGGSGRRDGLLADVRAVLVDGADPSPRAAILAALVYGSGTLPQFDPEIPWTSPVITRAEELKKGNWGAGAAAAAVARTVTATIVNNVIIAAAVLPRG
ncbi:GPP34 family phosphoprotein [Nonomuraea terrae]|uniref:GOLPH3/VPS74 family protein n=1 Tax=Nonomuraea terrae TaxID=2530383 RepID=UPI0037A1F1EC